MQYRKPSSTTNSVSNELNPNELTTYSNRSKKSGLNESFFTLYSDRKERDKDKSTNDSYKSDKELYESERPYEINNNTRGGIVEINRNLFESYGHRAKSFDLASITTRNTSIRSIVKINTTREVIKNRPPLPNQSLLQPSNLTERNRVSLQDKLFNYVESRIIRNKSTDVISEGYKTTSEYNPTGESEEKNNRSYFSFKGKEMDIVIDPAGATPKTSTNIEEKKAKKRSNSKVLDTIKKLTDSFRTLPSEGNLNLSSRENEATKKVNAPKINIEKVIRMSRRLNASEDFNRIFSKSNENSNRVVIPNKIKTIEITRYGVINLPLANLDKGKKVTFKLEQISKLQSYIRGFLFRTLTYRNVLRLDDSKREILSRLMQSRLNKNSIKVLRVCFTKWNKFCISKKAVPSDHLVKYSISLGMIKINKNFNDAIKRYSFNRLKEFRKEIKKYSTLKLIVLNKSDSYTKKFINCLVLSNSFYKWTNIILKHLRKLEYNNIQNNSNLASFIKSIRNILRNSIKHHLNDFFVNLTKISLFKTMSNKITRNLICNIDNKNRFKNLILNFLKWKNSSLISQKNQKIPIVSYNINSKQHDTLKFIIGKLKKRIFSKYKFSFLSWKIKTAREKFNLSSCLIQKFLRSKKKSISKAVLSYKQILQSKALQLLVTHLPHLFARLIFNKIKNEAKRRQLIRFVINLRNIQLKNFAYSFRKIKRFVQIKTIMTNAYARKIQQKFKLIKNRRLILFLIQKIRKLRKVLKILSDKNFRCINKSFKFWKRSLINNFWENEAKTIQNFMREILLQKRKIADRFLRSLFNDHLLYRHIKPFFKEFKQSVRIDRAMTCIDLNIKSIFINRLSHDIALGKFGRMLLLLRNKREFFLGMFLLRIKIHAYYFDFLKWIKKIQNFYKQRLLLKRNKKINQILFRINHILHKKVEDSTNLTSHFYFKWLRISNEAKITTAGMTIGIFIREKLNEIKFRKLWKKVSSRIISKYTMEFLKLSFRINKLFTTLMKIIFSKLRKIANIKKRNNILHKLLDNCMNNRIKIFHKAISIWKDQSEKLKQAVITKRNCLILSNNLSKAWNSLENDSLVNFANKIYKLFMYKILNSFSNMLNLQSKQVDINQAKIFIIKLKENTIKQTFYTNTIRHQNKILRKVKKFEFSSTKETYPHSKREPIIYLIPVLDRLCKKILNNRSEIFFRKLKFERQLFKIDQTLAGIIIKKPLEEFFLKLKTNCELPKINSKLTNYLNKAARSIFIKDLIQSLIKANRITKLMYILQLTNMHKKISEYKSIHIMIRKWAYYTHTIKLAKNKFSLICEGFDTNFKKLSNEIFNEDELQNEYADYKNIFDTKCERILSKEE